MTTMTTTTNKHEMVCIKSKRDIDLLFTFILLVFMSMYSTVGRSHYEDGVVTPQIAYLRHLHERPLPAPAK